MNNFRLVLQVNFDSLLALIWGKYLVRRNLGMRRMMRRIAEGTCVDGEDGKGGRIFFLTYYSSPRSCSCSPAMFAASSDGA